MDKYKVRNYYKYQYLINNKSKTYYTKICMYHTSFTFLISPTILLDIPFDFIYYNDTLWLYFLSKKI